MGDDAHGPPGGPSVAEVADPREQHRSVAPIGDVDDLRVPRRVGQNVPLSPCGPRICQALGLLPDGRKPPKKRAPGARPRALGSSLNASVYPTYTPPVKPGYASNANNSGGGDDARMFLPA